MVFATSTHCLLDQGGKRHTDGFADENAVDFVGEVLDAVVHILDVVVLRAQHNKELNLDVYRLHERWDECIVEHGDCFKGAFVLLMA